MTSKHYRWQTRWHVNLDASTATHDSGLVVRFDRADDDQRAWDGAIVDDPAVMSALLSKHGPHNIGPHLARLMREAGELFSAAIEASDGPK